MTWPTDPDIRAMVREHTEHEERRSMTRIIIQHDEDIPFHQASRLVCRAMDAGDPIFISIDNIEVIRRPARPDVTATSFIVRRVPPIV